MTGPEPAAAAGPAAPEPAAAAAPGPERIRVAVAGLGVIAQTVHLPLLERRRELFELVAVADLSPSRARDLGERYRVPAHRRFTDVSGLLDVGGFDALLLLTSGSHGELAGAALRHGVPVLCEKPLAYTRAEAELLVGLRDTGPGLMVGYMKQYDPTVTELARRLERIGGPAAVHAVEVRVLHPSGPAQLAFANLPPAPVDLPGAEVARLARADQELISAAVGEHPTARALYQIMINSVAHQLSLLRLLTGAPASVDQVAVWPGPAGAGGGPDPGVEPSVEVTGRLPAGGRYGIRWYYLPDYPAYRETVTVHHAGGSFELEFGSPYLLDVPTRLTEVGTGPGGRRQDTFHGASSGFDRELVALHALVTTGTAPLTGIPGGAADIVTSQQVVRRFGELSGTPVTGEAAEQ